MKNVRLSVLVLSAALGFSACTAPADMPTETSQSSQDQTQSQAVQTPVASPITVRRNGNEVSFSNQGTFVFFRWLSPSSVQVNYRPGGTQSPQTEVVGRSAYDPVDYSLNKTDQGITMTSDQLTVSIDPQSMAITYLKPDGSQIVHQEAYSIDQAGDYVFKHNESGGFYGLDSYSANETSTRGMLVESGGRVLAGSQGDAGAPFVWSKNFGLLFDSTGGNFKIDESSLAFEKHSKVDATYFFMTGDPMSIMETVYTISGTSPMFPKWAMGFTNSEWGLDQAELEEIIKTYREKDLPIDNYTLDFDWKAWGQDNYGEFRWNDEKFPDGASGNFAKAMLDQGVHLTGIFKPRILTQTIQGAYARKHGFFYPNRKDYREYFSNQFANDIDFSNAIAGAWYFNHVKQALDTGIVGYWNDEADELGDNLQHLNMQKALYLGQRGYNDTRVWSINRNFYLGAQKYAYGLWSGDIHSGFEAMAKQRETLLTAVNLGAAKWGMDTGGFNGPDPSEENYTRWLQMSAFTPIFRVHSTENRQRQPWVFGDIAEARAREVMNLRYALTPYVYAYERRAYDTGLGLVTPIFYHHPQDDRFNNYIDGWYFGDHLVYYPVVEEGATALNIELPEGTWTHYQTGKVYQGGSHTLTTDPTGLTDVNLFIKAGAILPKQPLMQYTGQKPVSTLSIDLFPSQTQTSFTLYDDDGATYAYEYTDFFKQTLSLVEKDKMIHITLDAPNGTYTPEFKTYQLRVNSPASSVTINGQAAQFTSESSAYGDQTVIKIPSGEKLNISINK